jgi:membrane protein implicated in regulation of membrane protease activity
MQTNRCNSVASRASCYLAETTPTRLYYARGVIDTVFLVCAIVGGGTFVIRTGLQLLGVGGGDGDAADLDDVHTDADAGFRVLSLQGLSAFFMMFGLVGLALVRESGVAPKLALGIAVLPGVASVWIIARLFALMGKLQSSGTLNMYSAIGEEGTVYLTLPRDDVGQVQVVVQGRLGVFQARERDGHEIPTGKRVRVVGVAGGDVLVVQAIESKPETQLTPI